jgi:serine/threonine protein kinase
MMIGTDDPQKGDAALTYRHQAGDEALPGYRLLEPLGRGGFGEVWKCEAPGGLLKAVKFIGGGDQTLKEHHTAAEIELKSIRSLRNVRHPFLLSMERVEHIKGELILVMELADRSLNDLLEAARQAGEAGMPREQVLKFLCEAAEVLDLMKGQHGLQHLDVKPRNLFAVSNHVKVGDFGLVHSYHSGKAAEGGGLSPLYSAPELFEGRISGSSDQYSLAIVYQELLTGRLPFEGKNPRQLLMQHLRGVPDLTGLPPADLAVVARALAKQPDKRFPSCSDFIAALQSGQADLVVLNATDTSDEMSGLDHDTIPEIPSADHGTDTNHEVLPPATPASPGPVTLRRCQRRAPLSEVWEAERSGGSACVAHVLFGAGKAGEKELVRLQALRHSALLPIAIAPGSPGRLIVIHEPPPPSLRDRWKECRAEGKAGIERNELLHYLKSAAHALEELRQRHALQHLALNPANVLLYRGRALLAEFGMAQLLWLPAGHTAMSFNARYAAPELFCKQVSPASDQYSLALIYHELLTGVLPTEPTIKGKLWSSQSGLVPCLERVPQGDRFALARALDPVPDKRWPSLSDFLFALETGKAPDAIVTSGTQDVAGRAQDAMPAKPTSPEVAYGQSTTAKPSSIVPRGALHARLGVGLTRDVIRLRIEAFLQQWEGTIVGESGDRLTLHLPAPESFWQRWSGPRPLMEVQLHLSDTAPGGTTLTDVLLVIRPHEGTPEQRTEMIRVVGPVLLDSIRNYLAHNSRGRREERIPWYHPLWLWAIREDGQLGPPVECQGKDISLNGIGFYLPVELPGKKVCLYLPDTEQTNELTVSAQLVRNQSFGDGWFYVGATLLAPWEGPPPFSGATPTTNNAES